MSKIIKMLSLLLVIVLALIFLLYLIMHSRQETAKISEAVREHASGKFIRLREGYTHYMLYGPDTGRLIVLVHGGGITGMEVWQHNIPFLLGKGYRVLSYDLYGKGYSDHPAITYDTQLFRDQLTQLLDTLGLSRPFDLVAMSMGAMIAIDFAHLHPERVKRMVLLDPAASGDLHQSKLLEIPVIAQVLMTVYWYPRAVEHQRKEFVNQPLFDAYAQRLKYFMNFKGYKSITRSTWEHMLNKNLLPLLDPIRPNTILLIYGLQDPYFSTQDITRYRLHYPTLQSTGIDSAGHMPHYERPDEVNEVIFRFLNQEDQ